MLFSEMIRSYDGETETEIERIYSAGEIIYEKDLLPIVFETNFIQATNWSIQYEPGNACVLGQVTEPLITKPGIVSGHTFTSWDLDANIAWPDADLNLFKNGGQIDFFWEPEYTGSPTQDVTLFETSTPKILIKHTSAGRLLVEFYNDAAALIKSIDAAYSANGKDRVRVIFFFDQGASNEITIKINDDVSATDTAFGDIDRGETGGSTITSFMPCVVKGEGGRGSRLRLHAELNAMTLEGVPMTLEGIPMFLGA